MNKTNRPMTAFGFVLCAMQCSWSFADGEDHKDAVHYTIHHGFLEAGHDLPDSPSQLSIAQAQVRCTQLQDCKGFTFLGDGSDKHLQRTIYFKSRYRFHVYPRWNTYRKELTEPLHPHPLASYEAVRRWLPVDRARTPRVPLEHIFGVSYGPIPRVRSDDVASVSSDFVMGHWYEGQWGPGGRNDIGIISRLGANAVILHSKNAWHRTFWHEGGHSAPQHQHNCVFKWFKFDPLAVRDHRSTLEMSDIEFKNLEGQVSFRGTLAKRWWDWRGDHGPANLIDGNKNTVYNEWWMQSVIFEMPIPVEVTGFRFTTGTKEDWDPVRWKFQASRDGKVWVTLHSQRSDFNTPRARRTPTKWFEWDNSQCRPRHHHQFNITRFLDNANRYRVKTIIGLPDHQFLYSQKACAVTTEMDCAAAIRHNYLNKMQLGLTALMGESQTLQYHPAVEMIVLMSEPENKIKEVHRIGPRKNYLRALISAFDGILAAEQESGLDPFIEPVRFTVTFSYSQCPTCTSFTRLESEYNLGCCVMCGNDVPCSEYGEAGQTMRCKDEYESSQKLCPALAQILDLHEAMKNPASVGYHRIRTRLEDKTLFDVYRERWVHSFNANINGVTFDTVKKQVLDKYEKFKFKQGDGDPIPIFIAEFKNGHNSEPSMFRHELSTAKALAQQSSSSFIGFNLHTFQVDYSLPCDESQWTMYKQGTIRQNPCPERAYGLFALGALEMGEAAKVPVLRHKVSFKDVPIHCLWAHQHWRVKAVADAFDGHVPDTRTCDAGPEKHPPKVCVASRIANASAVHRAGLYACDQLRDQYDCGETPVTCRDTYEAADWSLSIAYDHFKDLHPRFAERFCIYGGVGQLTAFPPRPDCTADPGTVSSSREHAPSPSDKPAAAGSLVVMMCLCMSLACTAASCYTYMRKPNLRRWAGVAPPPLTGNIVDAGSDPSDRGGTMELADWR